MRNGVKIRSNEIRQYCFCPRQWYLFRTTGKRVVCAASRRGEEFHKKAAQPIKAIQRTQSFMVALIIIGGIACIFWLFS